MDSSRQAYDQLIKGIQLYVDRAIEKSGKDETYTAIIKNYVGDGFYNILLNNKEYKNVPTLGGECSPMETVKVLIPQGNYSDMFILKSASSSSGGGGGNVNSVNGKTGDVVLTINDLGMVEVTENQIDELFDGWRGFTNGND